MAGVTVITCAECGSNLMKDDDGLWTDGGGLTWQTDGEEIFDRPGTMCSSGYDENDRHVPDVDLPDSLEPTEVEAWLAR